MAINSCQKGKRVERELVNFLRSIGFRDARRTQQHSAAGVVGDVECPITLPHIHFECKGVSGMDLGTKLLADACEQADRDCPAGRVWVVMWKPPRKSWRMTNRADAVQVTLDRVDDIQDWLCVSGACFTKLQSEAANG